MSITAGHGRGPHRRRGFTLIELLVVLVIIGLLVSLAVLSLGDNRGEVVKREADRLVALLKLARDEATLSGEPVGLHVYEDGYTFLSQQNADKWVAMTGDRTLGPRKVPEVVRLDVLVDGEPVTPEQRGLTGDRGDSDNPGLSDDGGDGTDSPGLDAVEGRDQQAKKDKDDKEKKDKQDKQESIKPQTVIYPSGEIYPFEIDVSGQEQQTPYYRITGEMHGEISMEKRD